MNSKYQLKDCIMEIENIVKHVLWAYKEDLKHPTGIFANKVE